MVLIVALNASTFTIFLLTNYRLYYYLPINTKKDKKVTINRSISSRTHSIFPWSLSFDEIFKMNESTAVNTQTVTSQKCTDNVSTPITIDRINCVPHVEKISSNVAYHLKMMKNITIDLEKMKMKINTMNRLELMKMLSVHCIEMMKLDFKRRSFFFTLIMCLLCGAVL